MIRPPFILLLALLIFQNGFSDDHPLPYQILYQMQSGNAPESINAYKEYYKHLGHHDLELVQRLGMILIDQGYRSQDPEIQVLTMFGAGISTHEKTIYV